MWVVFNASTGGEIDRTEDYDEARGIWRVLTKNDEWGYIYALRWEE